MSNHLMTAKRSNFFEDEFASLEIWKTRVIGVALIIELHNINLLAHFIKCKFGEDKKRIISAYKFRFYRKSVFIEGEEKTKTKKTFHVKSWKRKQKKIWIHMLIGI